jgi:ribonuclease HI
MIRIFTDGACQPNPGHMGIGVLIEWGNKLPTIISYYGGEGTNNIAEYMALLEALKQINDNDIRVVVIKSDSNLMVSQVNGKWKCNDQALKEKCNLAQNRIKDLKSKGFSITLEYIPREFNVADTPAKKGCSLK